MAKDPSNPANFYVTVLGKGIFRSTNSGESWSNITNNITGIGTETTNNNFRIAVHSKAGTTAIYAGVVNNSQLDSIWRSPDNGATWVKMDSPTTVEKLGAQSGPETTLGLHPGKQGNTHFSLIADPNDPNIVYVGGDSQPLPDPQYQKDQNGNDVKIPNSVGGTQYTSRLFRGDFSPQLAGKQWTPITDKFANGTATHPDSRNMTFDVNGNLLEVNDGGIYKRTNPKSDTGSWTSLNKNLGITEVHSVDYDANTGTIMVGAQDNGSSEGQAFGDRKWQERAGGDGGRVRIDDLNPEFSIRYASSQNLLVFHYRQVDTNKKVTGNKVYPALLVGNTQQDLKEYEGKSVELPFITPVELNKVKSDWLMIGTTKSVYESTDKGETLTDLTDKSLQTEVEAIAYGGKSGGVDNPHVLYIGAAQELYLRTAAGTKPTKVEKFPQTISTIVDIVLDPKDWNKAYVLTKNTVYL